MRKMIIAAILTAASMTTQAGWKTAVSNDGERFSAVGKSAEYSNTYLAIVFDSEDKCKAMVRYGAAYDSPTGETTQVVEEEFIMTIDSTTPYFVEAYLHETEDKFERITIFNGLEEFITHAKGGNTIKIKYRDSSWDTHKDSFSLNGSRKAITKAQVDCIVNRVTGK